MRVGQPGQATFGMALSSWSQQGYQEGESFEAVPGQGVRATVQGRLVEVGSRRLLTGQAAPKPELTAIVDELEAQGKTAWPRATCTHAILK